MSERFLVDVRKVPCKVKSTPMIVKSPMVFDKSATMIIKSPTAFNYLKTKRPLSYTLIITKGSP